jgi:peptidoglycan/LPS O-acetylase OafA/YrhL
MIDANLRQFPELRRVPELDGLRGVAILIVIVYHYVGTGPKSPPGSVLGIVRDSFRIGWSGVDLFFILSGFLIGGILLDARSSPKYFQTFYLRRVHRILPIYYLLVAVYALAAFLTVGHAPPPLEMSPLRPGTSGRIVQLDARPC